MGYRMSKHTSLSHFSPYFLLFGRHPIPPSSIATQMDQVVDLDSPATWARVIVERAVLRVIAERVALGSLQKGQVFHGDFVYLQRQPNDTLDTSSGRTILKIKATKPLGVLELQGADGRTICDHSKNYAPCHLPNLDPTIITSTWIPPLDYPCQVCQRTNDADQMLLCDNCNGGYHLFCLKPKLTQVFAGNWYYSSCFHTAP
ncbi:hypothetical protein CY35_09G017500 [Sphagnum magellanicum]|nr:hypothetical protein CY35_09G017500 [Sphagnum magellanicum]